MPTFDDYVIDVLMRDLVGHDRKPVSFVVYLWIAAEEARLGGAVSKSSAQAAVQWLLRRKLLAVSKRSVTATPAYAVRTPWRDAARRLAGHGTGAR